jgi:hypothetical protein
MPAPVRASRRQRAAPSEQPGHHHRVGGVGLVDDDELGHRVGTDLGEHLAHGRQLALGVEV